MRSDSSLARLLSGSRESTSRQRRDASQLGMVESDKTRRLQTSPMGARLLILRKWRSIKHSRLASLPRPNNVGGSSSSRAIRFGSSCKDTSEGICGAIKHRQVSEEKRLS